jgi:hypothetical protein
VEASVVSEREDIPEPTEKRDWDVPETPPDDAVEPDEPTGEPPADESEKRDWDLP